MTEFLLDHADAVAELAGLCMGYSALLYCYALVRKPQQYGGYPAYCRHCGAGMECVLEEGGAVYRCGTVTDYHGGGLIETYGLECGGGRGAA